MFLYLSCFSLKVEKRAPQLLVLCTPYAFSLSNILLGITELMIEPSLYKVLLCVPVAKGSNHTTYATASTLPLLHNN